MNISFDYQSFLHHFFLAPCCKLSLHLPINSIKWPYSSFSHYFSRQNAFLDCPGFLPCWKHWSVIHLDRSNTKFRNILISKLSEFCSQNVMVNFKLHHYNCVFSKCLLKIRQNNEYSNKDVPCCIIVTDENSLWNYNFELNYNNARQSWISRLGKRSCFTSFKFGCSLILF